MCKRTHAIALAAALTAAMLAGGCSKAPDAMAASTAASSAHTAPAAPVQVSDIDVTEHVKTALHQNEVLKGFDIGVVTLKGDVRLVGVLDNQAQIDEALRVARAADGAHSIHDELVIKQ